MGHDEPIIEVIDKFLCLGAFEHTSKEDVLLACGIRTVMNVRGERTNAAGARRESAGRERRRDGRSGEGLRDVGGSRARVEKRGETQEEASANGGDEIEGARRRFGDDVGSVDAIGGQKSAGTDERRDARERTERAAVHAVL